MQLNFLEMLVFRYRFELILSGICLVYLLVAIGSCNPPEACNFKYKNSSGLYCVNGTLNTYNNEYSRFIFYDWKSKDFVEAGFFQNGFRNGRWEYASKDNVQSIEWAYYKDKYLQFKTNVFSKIDSIKYGPFFSKLKFTTGNGYILLSVSTNGPFKDSMPEKNYVRNTIAEFQQIGASVKSVMSQTLQDAKHEIYVNEFNVKASNGENAIVKNAFSWVNKDLFVEVSVKFVQKDSFLATKLFEGVLTNSYFNEIRLYQPILKR